MIYFDFLKFSFIQDFYNKVMCRVYSNISDTLRYNSVIKTSKMCSFLHLINTGANELSFSLLIISAIILSSNTRIFLSSC